MLHFPDLPARTALKKIFRKQQVRELSEKSGLKLDNSVCTMSAQQFLECFVEMLKVVPDKFHPKKVNPFLSEQRFFIWESVVLLAHNGSAACCSAGFTNVHAPRITANRLLLAGILYFI